MMNHLRILILFFFVFLGNSMKAQLTTYPILHAGYAYQNQSFGEVGGRLLMLSNDDVIYRIGASALLGSVHSKFVVMPKVQGDVLINFEKNVDFYHSYYFLTGAEVTNHYVSPKAGVSLFGILDFAAGYAIPFGTKGLNGKELEGFNFNFTLNIPLVVFQ